MICVPSGNYGNVTGALLAWLAGLPVERLVVGSNDNDVVPRYLESGVFEPRPAVSTPANAMDVGDPSNFERIRALLDDDPEAIAARFSGFRVSTPEILATIRRVREATGYLLDPHGAVGYAALERHLGERRSLRRPSFFAATAHPAKFGEAILEATGERVEVPAPLAEALKRDKRAVPMGNDPAELTGYLLATA